jgi:RNA polymerase sigma-70 factor (ECF subfamily)
VQQDQATTALARFVAHADETAFRELISLYQPMVFAVCRRVLGTASDAEDATHETFIKLSRHAATIRGSIGSWLYTCALNVSRDQRHAAQARRAREREFVANHVQAEAPSFDADEYSLLNRCMAELDDQDREVIALYYFLGLTQEQIGARYGMTQAGVKRRLDRAIRALRFNLVRAGFDLSTAATGRACGVTSEGELDLVAFGAVLVALLLGQGLVSQGAQASTCPTAMVWGDDLGRRGAAVAEGLLLTAPERLGAHGRVRPSWRLTPLPFHVRAWHAVVTAAEAVRDGLDAFARDRRRAAPPS